MTLFERFPKLTLILLLSVFLSVSLYALNQCAWHFFGLGKPVLYSAHPIYGYHLQANQNVSRTKKQIIKINNLGLRAESDWELNDFQNKILFLGDSVTYGGSYIANQHLFSYTALTSLPPHYQSGNAGVNGWGVNNVCAYIKEMEFLPAQIYISLFPEGDFYRGLQRIGGQPFWTKKPRFALEELGFYFLYKLQLKEMQSERILSDEEKIKTAEIAIKNLKSLDQYLKQNNRIHLIYISPSRSQVNQNAPQDTIIKALFEKHNLDVKYLQDNIVHLPTHRKEVLFHDEIHLSPEGHQAWGEFIGYDLKQSIEKK